ncbi:MAG: hypothetical protein ACRDJX_07000 [Solirubrobacteraceae bacterium]
MVFGFAGVVGLEGVLGRDGLEGVDPPALPEEGLDPDELAPELELEELALVVEPEELLVEAGLGVAPGSGVKGS